MGNVVNAYENSVRFYLPKDAKAVLDDPAFWDRVDARQKQLCGDLAKELSGEYSVMVTASVGCEETGE